MQHAASGTAPHAPRARAAAVLAAALASMSGSAAAQSIDYGAFEALFGEPVTTSATGTPQRETQAPANMQIITAEEIRRAGATTIPDILQFVAGIDLRRYSYGQSEVAVRGYDQPFSPRLLVLVNGRQVYLDNYGYTAWQLIPVQMDEIRQIEVVKGPNSALFGYNAIGGVINIITFDPLADDVNVATVRAGSDAYASGSAVTTLRTDTAAVRLSAGAWRTDEFPTGSLPAAFAPYDHGPHQFAFSADGRLKLSSSAELTAETTYSGVENLDVPPLLVFDDAHYRAYSGKLGLVVDSTIGLLSLQSYYNHTDYEVATALSNVDFGDGIYVLQANDVFKLGAEHTLRLGLEYRYNEASQIAPQNVRDQLYAASVLWNWQLLPQLAVFNAVRLDHLVPSFDGSALAGSNFTAAAFNHSELLSPSFNSSLLYNVSANDTLRLMVARGIQAPSLEDLLAQSRVTGNGYAITYTGNPDLAAATLMNYELDYDRALTSLASHLRLALFFEDTQNLLASPYNTPLLPSAAGVTGYAQNIGSSRAFGGEFEIKGRSSSGWHWSLSDSILSIHDNLVFPDQPGPGLLLDSDAGSPHHMIDAEFGRTAGVLDFDLKAHWQSPFNDDIGLAFLDSRVFPIHAQLVLDARIAWRVNTHLTVALTGQQLADNQIYQAAGPPVDRRLIVSASAAL